MKLLHKGFLLLAIPIVAQFVFVAILLGTYRASEELSWKDLRYRTQTAELMNTSLLCYKAIGLLTAYGMSPQKEILQSFDETYDQLVRKTEYLALLQQDESSSNETIEKESRAALSRTLEKLLEVRQLLKMKHRQFVGGASWLVIAELKSELDKSLAILEELVAARSRSRVPDKVQLERSRWMFLTSVLAGFWANMLISAGLVVVYARDFGSRFNVVVENTKRLPEGLPLAEPVQGKDELAELDAAFHSMNQALKEAQDRRDQLIAMVTHDLRSPLTSINIGLEVLHGGFLGQLPDKANQQLSNVRKMVLRMMSLVNDILDFEKLRAGKLKLKLNSVVASEVVEDCLKELFPIAQRGEVELVSAVESHAVVIADRERMMQVLVNLISNAVKYSPSGGKVQVKSYVENGFVKLSVQDEGPGIPDEFIDTIFLPFEQVPETKRSKTPSTGLGLPICKLLVELHGGSLNVTSCAGEGSVFSFTLPEAEAESL